MDSAAEATDPGYDPSSDPGTGAPDDRPRRAKHPNERLASWFTRSGWSKGELARLVNRRAQLAGVPHVSTDTTRVRRWLDGEQPREPIPRILSDLFSERFGCPVTPDDLGLRDGADRFADSGVDLPWAPETVVEVLGDFARSDLMLGRNGFHGASLALSAGPALVEPMQRWLAPAPAPEPVAGPVPGSAAGSVAGSAAGEAVAGRLTPYVLACIDESVRLFRDWDSSGGGGLRRKAVVGQLYELTDLLHEARPGPARTRLFGLTAELAQLAGWMSYDVGMHPGAQKYYVLALHAAKEAGDRPLGAHILALMSRQMMHLGRCDDALELLHLAQYGSRDTAGPALGALLCVLQARAHALRGDAERCRRCVALAERTMADPDRDRAHEPDWIRPFTDAELRAEIGYAYRDLAYQEPAMTVPARACLTRAAAMFAGLPAFARSRALTHVALASVHLLEDEPHAVCEQARRALEIGAGVRSERLAVRLRAVARDALERHGDLPEVRELAARLLGRGALGP